MKCLIVTANPAPSSFSYSLAKEFQQGLKSQGHESEMLGLFEYPDINNHDMFERIAAADGVCFAFPWWCEMPPYPMVEFWQKNLVEGKAFKHVNGVKVPLIKKPTQVLITMGSPGPEYNISHVRNALKYVGLNIEGELVCLNVGQGLSPEAKEKYLKHAEHHGKVFFQ